MRYHGAFIYLYIQFFFSEILPVVEFVVEEEITDEEAVHLIQQSGSGKSDRVGSANEGEEEQNEDNRWKETESGDAQALMLDGSPSHMQNSDPFTSNLLGFYVRFKNVLCHVMKFHLPLAFR